MHNTDPCYHVNYQNKIHVKQTFSTKHDFHWQVLMQNQSGYMYELLNLEDESSVNSDNSDATDLRF